jgi:hypothetical protein
MVKINDSACKIVQQVFDYVPPQPVSTPRMPKNNTDNKQDDAPQKMNPRFDYLNCVVYTEP